MSDDRTFEPEILRGTSDQLMIAIAEVGTLERRKRLVSPSEPEVPGPGTRGQGSGRTRPRALTGGRGDRAKGDPGVRWSRHAADRAYPPGEGAWRILEEWRAVEQRLLAAPAGSDEAEALAREFEALRQRYADTLTERTENG